MRKLYQTSKTVFTQSHPGRLMVLMVLLRMPSSVGATVICLQSFTSPFNFRRLSFVAHGKSNLNILSRRPTTHSATHILFYIEPSVGQVKATDVDVVTAAPRLFFFYCKTNQNQSRKLRILFGNLYI